MTHGITHLTTHSYTLRHNRYFECRHRHIVKTDLTLMHQASLHLTFWPYAFAMAIYLIHRTPKVGLSLGSSYEKLFNKAPYLSKLRVFGCLCFPWLCPYSSHKLDLKSSPCVFLGYSLTQSVFLYFDPTLKKIFVSRHVKFLENVFLFASLSTSATSVLDTTSTLLASSFPSFDYLAPPPYSYHQAHPNYSLHQHPLTYPPIELPPPYPYYRARLNCSLHHQHPTHLLPTCILDPAYTIPIAFSIC